MAVCAAQRILRRQQGFTWSLGERFITKLVFDFEDVKRRAKYGTPSLHCNTVKEFSSVSKISARSPMRDLNPSIRLVSLYIGLIGILWLAIEYMY